MNIEHPTSNDQCSTGKPVRVQLSRKKGWRLPPNTVVVARPTKWGNPYVVGVDGPPVACVFKFHIMLCARLVPEERAEQRRLRRIIKRELRGKNLACWCALDQPCHADVLLKVANE